MVLISRSAEETFSIGYTIGQHLKAGSVVCIQGELGAGKTAISQGIIKGLGVEEKYITSPTYTIVNEYNTSGVDVFHFDVYRISDVDELQAIGFEEYLREDSVSIVEWADLFKDVFSDECIWITMNKGDFDNRYIEVDGFEDENLEFELRKWLKK